MSGAVSFRTKSSNRKLSPVEEERSGGVRRLLPRRPFCCSTYVSIAATCTDRCPFKARNGEPGGCYAEAGATKNLVRGLDAAAADEGMTKIDVIAAEALLIDGRFPGGVPQDGGRDGRSGRDLRLHVSGDVGTTRGARMLASAAERWVARGGGTVFTTTHNWRHVPREAWGPISVLASVEHPSDVERARARGYAAAIVVAQPPDGQRAFQLPGTAARIVPCPNESRGVTCVECRLCLDRDLLAINVAIGFFPHGPGRRSALRRLPVLPPSPRAGARSAPA